MAKPEWGTKRECPDCGARFYDLGKEQPLICPKCSFEYEPEVVLKPKRLKPVDEVVKEVVKPPEPKKEPKEDEENDIEELTGGDDALLEADDDDNDEDKLLEIDDDEVDEDVADDTNALDDPNDLPVDDDNDDNDDSPASKDTK